MVYYRDGYSIEVDSRIYRSFIIRIIILYTILLLTLLSVYSAFTVSRPARVGTVSGVAFKKYFYDHKNIYEFIFYILYRVQSVFVKCVSTFILPRPLSLSWRHSSPVMKLWKRMTPGSSERTST